MQIIILGMHRSGTSVVARLLNMMGAYFAPERVELPLTTANPKGYWERRDVINLNEDILTALGITWDNIHQFKSADMTSDIQTRFESYAREIILGLDANRPWMLKDPRLCLLLPFWQPLFEIPVCVYVHRSPLQVAQSLKKREGFPLMLSIALWEKYNLQGLANSADMPRILVSHEEIMKNPVVTVNKLYQDLIYCEVQGLRLPSDKEIQAFIDPNLFHEQGNVQLQSSYINSQQALLFEAFEKGGIFQLKPLPNLSQGAAEILEAYKDKLEEMIGSQKNLEELKQSLQTQAKEFQQSLQTQKAENAKYQAQAASYRNQLSELGNKTQALQTQLTSTKKTLSEKEQSLSTQIQETEVQRKNTQKLMYWIGGLDHDIKAIFNSLTWRSGNLMTQIALKLMFKKAGQTAQDHIQDILAEIAAWNLSDQSGEIQQVLPTEQQIKTPSGFSKVIQPRNYQSWIKNYDTLTQKTVKRMQQLIKEWNAPPFISIVMPTYNTDEKLLRAAIDSVLQQIYPNWELCIADDASTKGHVRRILEEYAERDKRIKLKFRSENGHISAASNTALEIVNGEFVAFLDHDDMLNRHALFWVAKDILDYPDAMLWYSDEDKINKKGSRFNPYFKSDWNPDLFLSHNLITHLAVYRKTLIEDIGGFREGYEGAQDYDLVLRAIEQMSNAQIRHIPRVLYHWREVAGSTASRPDEKPYAIIAAQKAISEHLERRNIKARVTESPDIRGTIRVQYTLPVHLPLVSLIIPTRNSLNFLSRCVKSILDKTDYDNFEILIINNNSDDPATLDYMQQLEKNDKARIIDYPHPFSYADMNNQAVEQAQGEIIGLLNNDLEVINSDWLSEMVSHAVRPEVGAVGAKLWYPNNTLQHGGVVLGIGGVAGHAHKGFPRGHVGYFGRAALIQNFSAVTAACMVMRKANFLAVGGLDGEHLGTALNDVDLCLKMNEHNLRIVWTPYAELYHHESASRGYEDTPEKKARYEKERAYMKSRWPQFLMADPAYSPNLTLEAEDFAYAWPPRVPPI
jgi:glycosyltransferase involved in cell wall biosynthesis